MSNEAVLSVQYYISRKSNQLFYLHHTGQEIIYKNAKPVSPEMLMGELLYKMMVSLQEVGATFAILNFLTHSASLMLQEEFNVRQKFENVSGPTIPYALGKVEVQKRMFSTRLAKLPGGPEGKIGWIMGDLDQEVEFFYSIIIGYIIESGSHAVALKFPKEEMEKFTWQNKELDRP